MTDETGAGTLEALFAPGTVAVVGASATPGKAGHAMVAALSGFGGPVFAVNPGRPVVNGTPAFASVRDIGRPVDLAILVVPAPAVPDALEDCGEAGVRAAVVCAGGFAESPRGGALQDEILAVVRRHGIRLLGPNTSGFMNPAVRLCANFVPTAACSSPGRWRWWPRAAG